MSKPSIIIFGGCGFLGRNLVAYLAESGLCSKIKVVDKQLPGMAGLSKKQSEIFKDNVEFMQANLAKEANCKKAFEGGEFTYAINLAGETKYSQSPEIYKENIVGLSTAIGKAAAAAGVKAFIEVSTSQVYASGLKKSDEKGKLEPWTKMAEAKLKAEEELRSIKGLNLIVVRPALVYGPGDITSVTPRVIIGAVYKHLNEKLEFLWDSDLKLNTVHVEDCTRALWHLCLNGTVGEVYNLADEGNTDQGEIAKILEGMFGVKTGFMGTLKSKAATALAMKTVVESVNDKHLTPWSELCKSKGIVGSPLTPYLDEELLYHDHTSVDGTKITKTGFTYNHKKITEGLVREATEYFVENGAFPAGYVNPPK